MFDTLLGKLVDNRYQLIAELGQGGIGTVYRAQEVGTDRIVAVKFLHQASTDEESKARFLREAKVWSTLSHPNIGLFYRFGTWLGERSYIAMEYLPGTTLAQYLHDKGRLPWREVTSLCCQICEAIEYLHSHDVVHRDLKPSNIILVDTPQGVVAKVIDFGLARSTAGDLTRSQSLTASGMLMGSFPYMSPEQCKGAAVDNKIDVYAMGCIIFELIAGEQVFCADNPIGLVYKHSAEPPRVLGAVVSSVPAALAELVTLTLSKSPSQRPAVQELKKQLQAIQEQGVDGPVLRPGPPNKTGAIIAIVIAAIVMATMFKGKLNGADSRAKTPASKSLKLEDEIRLQRQSAGLKGIETVCKRYLADCSHKRHLDRICEADYSLAFSTLAPVLMSTGKYDELYELCQCSLSLLNSAAPVTIRTGQLRDLVVLRMAECSVTLGHSAEAERLLQSIPLLKSDRVPMLRLRHVIQGQIALARSLVDQNKSSDAASILEHCLATVTAAIKSTAIETRQLIISSIEIEVRDQLGSSPPRPVDKSASEGLNAVSRYLHLQLGDVYRRMGRTEDAKRHIPLSKNSQSYTTDTELNKAVEYLGSGPLEYQYYEALSGSYLIENQTQSAVESLWLAMGAARRQNLSFQCSRLKARAIFLLKNKGMTGANIEADPFTIYEGLPKIDSATRLDTALSTLERLYAPRYLLVMMYMRKCQFLKSVNNWVDAEKAATLAVQKATGVPQIERSDAMALLAECLDHNGKDSKAAVFICDLEKDPDLLSYETALSVLETVYVHKGDVKALRRLYGQLTRTESKYNEVRLRMGGSLAFLLATNGEKEQARRLASQIRSEPGYLNHAPTVWKLAALYEQTGDIAALREIYSEIPINRPSGATVRRQVGLRLADWLSRKGEGTEADKLIREARNSCSWSTDLDSLEHLLNIYERNQDLIALRELYQILQQNPDLVSTRLWAGMALASCLNIRGETAKSDELMRQIKSLSSWSRDANCVWRLAEIYLQRNDASALRELYQGIPEPWTNRSLRLSVAMNLATCLDRTGHDQEANNLIGEIRSSSTWSKDPNRMWRMAIIYKRRHDIVALQELYNSIPIPNQKDLQRMRLSIAAILARCLGNVGRNAEADALISDIKSFPDWSEDFNCVWYWTLMYESRENVPALRALYQTIRRTRPDSPARFTVGACLAECLSLQGKTAEADSLIREVRSGTNWSTLLWLAKIYQYRQDIVSLRELYNRTQKHPDWFAVRLCISSLLADCLSRKGEDAEADKLIREIRSCANWSTDNDTLSELTNIYERRRDILALGELYRLIPQRRNLSAIRLRIHLLLATESEKQKGQSSLAKVGRDDNGPGEN